MNNQSNPNQVYLQYPYPTVPPQGQQSYPYGQTGQNPYYPYGEPPKEGRSIGWIILLILGVVLTGGLAWWWIKNKKGTSSTKTPKGLYEVQQETIQRLNVTVAEQEGEIDRLTQLLKVSKQLVDPNNTWSNKADTQWDKLEEKTEEAKLPVDPHILFRDSFGLDLSQKKNKVIVDKMNEAIDWLITKQEFYSVQEVDNQYKNDKGCKVNFSEVGGHILLGERKVFVSADEIVNGQFYEKYQAFIREETK